MTATACLSCARLYTHIRRGCCAKCVTLIESGLIADVRTPSTRRPYGKRAPYVASPEAVRLRIAATLARYPHLRGS